MSETDPHIKLSCRNLWKVYAGEKAPYFKSEVDGADGPALATRMRGDGAIPAAADVSFDVRIGEIFVIMGLSGSGKSTVVRCLSRLVEPTHGEVLLDGEDLLKKTNHELIDIRRHKMGMVFQNFGLMPHLSVFDNIAFPLVLQGVDKAERIAQVRRVIELVGLEGRETSFPRQLSGGQQQRVGIARSLAIEPELWFLDEPFSALDPLIRRQMQDEFLRIQRTLKKSIVFITHDFLEALRIADRMMIMRDGLVVQQGTPTELITNPADDYVAEFTEDVPMVRVLKARDVLDPDQSPAPGMAEQDCEACVDDILPLLSSHKEGVVAMRDGAPLGVVTAASVIAALASRDADRGEGAAS
ncbi:ATP-binding cassette domain-containing protein [Roseovarius faecimaris]|uniref:Trimethylamine N-oxide transport system ATP-binding protein TmoW n=1 Tax=Roseovarius faecimaris TaxID=2494550 RepID=A0A6I6IS22_9RHOB|nr:ATP-binding cassette domain-containing protein [Roseovarius faecimaris]QGX98914.1 ATP-binding cassette domain-containing protein [Roseovarius faecimaris]